jgi:hypothetical protein
MIIEVSGHRSPKFKAMLSSAIESYCTRIISKKILKTIHLKVYLKKKLEYPSMQGYCYYVSHEDGIREFEIAIKKNTSLRELLIYIAHECVHVKQLASGELKDGVRKCKWQGQLIEDDKLDYWDLPWEIEAYGREKGLYHRFIVDYKKTNKVKLDSIVR